MQAIQKQDVINFAGELSGVADAVWMDLLAYVNQYDLSQVASDIDARMARIMLAAHMATENKKAASGAVGPVTAVSAGGVRRSYGLVATAASSSTLGTTRYGQLFLDIVGRTPAGMMVV